MNIVAPEILVHQLGWRYATKQFDAHRKISAKEWAALEEALVLTPSSFGLQPWKFIVVNDTAIREKLLAASWGQKQIVDASHLVVFAIKKNLAEKEIEDYVKRIVEVRGGSTEALSGFRDMMVGSIVRGRDATARETWAAHQVYIALGNFLTCTALLAIDACPMEGIDPAKYDEILGLENLGLTTVVVAAAGHRAASDKHSQHKKVRFLKEHVVLTL